MKQRVPPTALVNNQTAFPQLTLQDIAALAKYPLDSLRQLVLDMILMPGSQGSETGGNIVLTGGLSFNVIPPLRFYHGSLGKQFELMETLPHAITLQNADPTNARIDCVYVTWTENVASDSETRHYKIDPTVPASQEGDVLASDEIWDTLTLGVATGTPAAVPVAPNLPTNSVLLWTITVKPNATFLNLSTDVIDNRHIIESLEALGIDVAALRIQMNKFAQITLPLPASQVLIGAGAGSYSGLTDQQAWAVIGNQSDQTSNDPITRPEIQNNGVTTDGRLGAVANLDGTTPVIDLPPSLSAVFSNVTRKINVNRIPSTANPRLVNTDVNAPTQTQNKTTPLPGNYTVVSSTGGGSWVLKNGAMPVAKSQAACAARDTRYIEIFGGVSTTGGALGDWATYDTLSDAVTARVISPALPSCLRPAMFPCGDGIHVLVGCAGAGVAGQNAPRWFVVNCVTAVSVEIFNGPQSASPGSFFSNGFQGDLVQTGVIVVSDFGDGNFNGPRTWSFTWSGDPSTGAFTQLNTSGIPPAYGFSSSTACFYQQGQLVIFSQTGSFASGRTTIFNYTALTYTDVGGQSPYNPFSPQQAPVGGARMRNYGGTPLLAMGSQEQGGNAPNTAFWILTPGTTPTWQFFIGNLPHKHLGGDASLLVNGLPQGQGFVFGGGNVVVGGGPDQTTDIWTFQTGGVIITQFTPPGGTPVSAITLAPGTTQATILLSDFVLPWQVATILASLQGVIPPGSVQFSYSFDNDAHTEIVQRDIKTSIPSNSAATPSTRRLRITMYSQGANSPILASLFETFEQVAGPQLSGLVLRFNVPAGSSVMFIARDGTVTFEATAVPTTPDKAVLMTMVNNGTNVLATIAQFINKRHIQKKYGGNKSVDVDPTFFYEPAVVLPFVDARAAIGGASSNAKWTVTVNATTFTLTFGAQTTPSQTAATETAAALQSALAALSSIGAHNVRVSGPTGGPFVVELYGTLANTPEAAGALTGAASGGAATITINQTSVGNAGTEYKIPDPTLVFNSTITVLGMGATTILGAASVDAWAVEVSE
jgi:hypothetical protein